ncbi:MAG TPA: alkaline phosphatase family protein [Candidatus Krumholzibacteria bacterium]|nr:alkaline phosphatase family protein [Candidatus Krumholzibacteria bacterium]
MKRIRLVVIAIAALLLLGAAAGLKRVPADREAVRVGRDGGVAVLASGWHWVGPGTTLIRYPSGEHSFRVPESDSFHVIFQMGDSLAVAYEFDLAFPPGSSEVLYRQFSKDFEDAFSNLVVSVAEIEAASRTTAAEASDLDAAVVDQVRDEMQALGVEVRRGARARADASMRVESKAPRRLVIVGVDGGDWQNLKPLIDAGRLPNFARLVREGATGPLRSEEPMLSPLLWTTMATGRYPEDHGVLNFTVVDPKTGARVPISRLYRKVDAFWNMLSRHDRRVVVVGWLATDPAEAIDGVMVTDKFGYVAYAPTASRGDSARASAPSSVHPRARAGELAGMVVHADAITDDQVGRFVQVPHAELSKHRGSFDPKDPVNNLIHLYASTLTFRNIATTLWQNDQPDVLAVYFEWVDAMSHLFMLHASPRMPDVPEKEYARYSRAIDETYVAQDEILGEIMSKIDERTVLMVVSDHGFKSGESRLKNRPEIWAGNAALWHRIDGIVAFFGAGVKRGATIDGASILDVAPTILALQGLPRAGDMPGKPLASAFDDAVVATFSSETVATLDGPRGEAHSDAAASSADAETMKKLEALGYLAPDNADAHNNLGQRYQERGEYEKAIAAYKEAIAMRPNFHGAYNNLAVCYGKLKRYDEAEAALRKCIALKPDDFYAMNNLAVMLIETQRIDEGLRFAEQAVKTEPAYANGHVTLGSAYAMTRRFDEAEREFREALRLDPANNAAATNLDRLAQARAGAGGNR